jgi:hypothetical protein
MSINVMSKMMSALAIVGLLAAVVAGRLHYPFFYVIWIIAFLALIASLVLRTRGSKKS